MPSQVEVAVFCPLFKTFTYLWPDALGQPEPGIRVRVPFGRGSRTGVVLSINVDASPDIECKTVLDRLDADPLYDGRRRAWLERARRYYLAAPGEMNELALAWAAGEDKRRWQRLDGLEESDPELAAVFGGRHALSVGTMRRKLPSHPVYHRLRQAARSGLVQEVTIDGGDAADMHTAFSGESIPEQLTQAQEMALDALLASDGFATHLLFGRTGSGKTEVYLRAAQARVEADGQVLILVPEIGLTPQWLARLTARFGKVAVWHSALTETQRLQVRQQLGKVDVLVGTRSALFLPLPRLAMIVVDEEHDGSFKQQEGVCYSARDLSILLAQELDIPVVLGSATPALESWRQVAQDRYQLLELPQRISAHASPKVKRVDMRGTESPISEVLLKALGEVWEAGGQSLLFLNRRGYAPALICSACGDVPECPACSLRLTLHRRRKQLRCHACGFVRPVPVVCEACGEEALLPLGEGTEKVEEQLLAALPGLRIARFDRDVVRSAARLQQLLADVAARRVDCLIGTQMVVKGHHFPHVSLVGVVNADLGLNLPDFRAGERWWQQLTQVLGRAGRGDAPGRVIVQTRDPQSPWLDRIGDEQARSTLDEELVLREALCYPPFSRWVRVIFSAGHADRARRAAEAFVEACGHLPEVVQPVGPMPCALERLASRYRFEVIVRDESRAQLPWCLEPLLRMQPVPSGVRRRVDVDPVDMM